MKKGKIGFAALLMMLVSLAGSAFAQDCGSGIPPVPMSIQSHVYVNGEPVNDAEIDIYLGGEYFKTVTTSYNDQINRDGYMFAMIDACNSDNGKTLTFKYEDSEFGTFQANETPEFKTWGILGTGWNQSAGDYDFYDLHFDVYEVHTITGPENPIAGQQYTYNFSIEITDPLDEDETDGTASARQVYIGYTDADGNAKEIMRGGLTNKEAYSLFVTLPEPGDYVLFYHVEQIDSTLENGIWQHGDQYEIKHESLEVTATAEPYQKPEFMTFHDTFMQRIYSWLLNLFSII